MNEATILFSEPEEIGGHMALSRVSDGYQGTCAVFTLNGGFITSVPSFEEARKIANYAITPNGGYGSVEIIEHDLPPVTSSFDRWLFRF